MIPRLIGQSTATPYASSEDALADRIAAMDPISLSSLDEVKLLDRIDTKFLLCDWQLGQILNDVRDDYAVLAVTESRVNRYRTLYFDTHDLTLYHQHHNDRRNRYKVRCRHYLDADLFFLEIKFKTGNGRTIKSRLQMDEMVERLEGEAAAFVAASCPLDVASLHPKIWNAFSRITLVSKRRKERLTLDIDYRHHWHSDERGLPGIAIAEIKQRKFSYDSEFMQHLRQQRIRKIGFSKYCAGIADLYPQVKQNRFKRRTLMLERLSRMEEMP